jgi:hypothetical protein
MSERRTLERFDLQLPAKLQAEPSDSSEQSQVHELETENISSGGAFFRTLKPFIKGTRVKIEIALHYLERDFHAGKGSLVKLTGEVLRTEPTGMAVAFERPYRILPVSA